MDPLDAVAVAASQDAYAADAVRTGSPDAHAPDELWTGSPDANAQDVLRTGSPDANAPDELWTRLRERVGLRPIVDGCLPPLAFLAAFVASGTRAAVLATIVTAVLLVLYRAARHEGVRPAIVALIVLLLAASLVHHTGQGVNLFLPDLIGNALLALWFATSLLTRRPATATLLRLLGVHGGDLRGHQQATAIWLALWCVHLSAEVPLYLAKDTLALAVVRIALGPPMWLPVGWLGWRIIRRSEARG